MWQTGVPQFKQLGRLGVTGYYFCTYIQVCVRVYVCASICLYIHMSILIVHFNAFITFLFKIIFIFILCHNSTIFVLFFYCQMFFYLMSNNILVLLPDCNMTQIQKPLTLITCSVKLLDILFCHFLDCNCFRDIHLRSLLCYYSLNKR